MKLAFVRVPLLSASLSTLSLSLASPSLASLSLAALAGVCVAPSVARAETVEVRAAVMLRDKPATSGHVVDRVPTGAKLTMIEMSEDGGWARVRGKNGKEGWLPAASLRKRNSDKPSGEEPQGRDDDEGMAKRRNVRPETWVSKSKYHEEDNKMTVTAGKAELYGRPQATGTVLGIVRRGEVVQFVRRSADKKWVQIDIGAGELAWVDARSVRMGADMQRADTAPDESRRPSARDERRDDRRDEPPRRDEPAPTPSRRKVAEPSPDDLRRADRARDEEPPPARPGDEPKRRDEREETKRRAEREDAKRREDLEDQKRRDEREEQLRREEREDRRRRDTREEARRRDEDRDQPSRRRRDERADRDRDRERSRDRDRDPDRDRSSSRPRKPPHGNNYVDVRLKFGFAAIAERVRTNGTSTALLRNYEFGTTNVAVGGQLGYSHAWNKLRLHIDLKYLAALAGSVIYHQSDTVSQQLFVLDQNIGGGIAVGGYWDAAGGVDLRLRVGADTWINQITASNAPLAVSSNIVLGMTIGLEFAMPEVAYLAGRPFGFRIKGGALAPATRIQQANLQTTPSNSTIGGYAGLSLHYGLLSSPKRGQLHLEASYDFSFALSHFTGACPPTTSEATRVCRDDSVDDANYTSSQHVGAIGLYYQY